MLQFHYEPELIKDVLSRFDCINKDVAEHTMRQMETRVEVLYNILYPWVPTVNLITVRMLIFSINIEFDTGFRIVTFRKPCRVGCAHQRKI